MTILGINDCLIKNHMRIIGVYVGSGAEQFAFTAAMAEYVERIATIRTLNLNAVTSNMFHNSLVLSALGHTLQVHEPTANVLKQQREAQQRLFAVPWRTPSHPYCRR